MSTTVGQYIYNIRHHLANGFYVDVGAYDGITMDETLILEQIGWNGICIEGHPIVYEKLKQNRKAQCYNAFVGRKSGEIRRVVKLDPQYSGSGFQDNLPENHQQFLKKLDPFLGIVNVQTKHLEDILDELNAPPYIHLLKTDTEGACLEIVQSLSFTRYFFEFISLELGLPGIKDSNYEEGLKFLTKQGYKHLTSFNQNDIFHYDKI